MKDGGCSCDINMSRESAIMQANDCFNEGLYRICKALTCAADTPRKKQNATAKIQNLKQLLKDSSNKDQIKSNISALIGIENRPPVQPTTDNVSVASSTDEPINIFWTE